MNEEDFPSLIKNKAIFYKPEGNTNEWFIDIEIQEHCIDKQKLKDAEHWLRGLPEYALKGYRKELGLLK